METWTLTKTNELTKKLFNITMFDWSCATGKQFDEFICFPHTTKNRITLWHGEMQDEIEKSNFNPIGLVSLQIAKMHYAAVLQRCSCWIAIKWSQRNRAVLSFIFNIVKKMNMQRRLCSLTFKCPTSVICFCPLYSLCVKWTIFTRMQRWECFHSTS